MQRYILQRLLLMIPTVVGLTIIVFTALRLASGSDAVDLIVGRYGEKDPALEEELRQEFGLTDSVPRQYLNWVSGIVTGDFGNSLHTKRSVSSELQDRLLVSFELGGLGLLIAVLVAVPIGMLSAIKQDRWPDYILRSAAILLNSIPGFWAATLVITLGSLWFNWAPSINFRPLTEDTLANLKTILLPAVLIALAPLGGLVRLVRTQMLEVLRQDYVRTARSKGLSASKVYTRHALRNALLPVVTVIGLQLPSIVAGTVIFEQIFVLPGVGRYLVDSISQLDYPVIQATNLVFALIILASTLVVDLSYAVLDPRIRYS